MDRQGCLPFHALRTLAFRGGCERGPSMRVISLIVSSAIAAAALWGCSTAPKSQAERNVLTDDVKSTIALFERNDPGMRKLFEGAYGYAVFPSIGKGAVGVGGAYGRGQVFEKGNMIGYCDVSQGSIGLQIGGQSYRQVIFFETHRALYKFRYGQFALAANASAVAADSGASATNNYTDEVLVFTMTRGGLMYEAAVGGQNFTFEPR